MTRRELRLCTIAPPLPFSTRPIEPLSRRLRRAAVLLFAMPLRLPCSFTVEDRAFAAAQKSDTILPNTTKGYLSIGNVDELKAAWNKTQLGQLMNDPVMKPFADDLGQQLQKKWTQTHRKLGIVWEDMEGVPGGEVGTAVIQPGKDQAAFAIVVDITGSPSPSEELLDKIHKNMMADGAKRTDAAAYGAEANCLRCAQAGRSSCQAGGVLCDRRSSGRCRQPEGSRRAWQPRGQRGE